MASIAASEPALTFAPRRRSRARALVRTCRSKPIGVAAGAVCLLLVLIAICADQLAPHAPDATKSPRMHASSRAYPLGPANRVRDTYGRLPQNLAAALAGSCAMVASYGALDGSLEGAADTLRDALERAGVEHDVKEYADAGHSFLNHSAETAPRWMKPLTGSLNAGFVDTAAADAWDRITRMFDTALR